MKNGLGSCSFLEGAVSRRKFIGQAGTAAIGFSIVPRRVLLGNVATRAGQKLNWDRAGMNVNADAAQKYVRPERRSGWEL